MVGRPFALLALACALSITASSHAAPAKRQAPVRRAFTTAFEAKRLERPPRLVIGGTRAHYRELSFRVTGITGRVKRATLRLYASKPSRIGFTVRRVHAPRSFARLPAARSGSLRRGWSTVDITRFVRGNGDLTFRLATRSRRPIRFVSRRSGLRSPQLIVRATGNPYVGRVGFSAHLFTFGDSEADLRVQLQKLRAGGVDWIREAFYWCDIEPHHGEYDWSDTDKLMAALSAERVNMLGILAFSATWASTEQGDYLHPPRDPAEYAKFAEAIVSRYGTNGSFWTTRPELAFRPLRALEIWNEPFAASFWKPEPDPAAYARLARTVVLGVRTTDPEVKLLISGDLYQARADGQAASWLDALLAADPGLPSLVDGFSVHLYCWDAGPYWRAPTADAGFGRVVEIRRVAARRNVSLPIWITEVGWTTASVPGGVSEKTQADYTRGAVVRAIGDWGGFVSRVFFYSWAKSSPVPGDAVMNYGFVRSDGTVKPAWDALVQLLDEQP